jgi:hypothetical protein
MIISKSFTADGVSASLLIKKGEEVHYSFSGNHVGTITVEYSVDNSAYVTVEESAVTNATMDKIYKYDGSAPYALFRLRVSSYASGTIVGKLIPVPNKKMIISAAGQGKAGTTAGFVVAAGDNLALVTCPASQTASTLVIPVPYLNKDQAIKGFHLIGQVESAGNTATVDCALRKMTSAAADVSDAAVASMTQVSCTADTILGFKNTLVDGLNEIVDGDETFYFLITVTTAASTDVALQGVALIFE